MKNFYEKVYEKFSKLYITMPFSPDSKTVNENGFAQFYTVEDPASIRYQKYELYPSLNNTRNKEMLFDERESDYTSTIVFSRGKEINNFILGNSGHSYFFLPLEKGKRNLSFQNVIESLSYDAYTQFLEETDQVDSKDAQEEFLEKIDSYDGVEFAKPHRGTPNIYSNASGYIERLPKDSTYECYLAVFHRLAPEYAHLRSQIERKQKSAFDASKKEDNEKQK